MISFRCAICSREFDASVQLICTACGDPFCIECHKKMSGVPPNEPLDISAVEDPLCTPCASALDIDLG